MQAEHVYGERNRLKVLSTELGTFQLDYEDGRRAPEFCRLDGVLAGLIAVLAFVVVAQSLLAEKLTQQLLEPILSLDQRQRHVQTILKTYRLRMTIYALNVVVKLTPEAVVNVRVVFLFVVLEVLVGEG